MTAVTLRRAGLQDCADLSQLGEQTFRETFVDGFAIPYPPEDLAVFLPQTYGREATARLLADPDQAAWIAELDGQPVGYALTGPAALPYPEVCSEDGELKRLYVLRAAQGHGLGRRLMETALAWLERDGPRPLWIGVWSGNVKAQRFYEGYGFAKFGEHVFPVGRWLDREFAFRRGVRRGVNAG